MTIPNPITFSAAGGLLEVRPGPSIRIILAVPLGRAEVALTPAGAVALGRALVAMGEGAQAGTEAVTGPVPMDGPAGPAKVLPADEVLRLLVAKREG